jgi:hypothetical protein
VFQLIDQETKKQEYMRRLNQAMRPLHGLVDSPSPSEKTTAAKVAQADGSVNEQPVFQDFPTPTTLKRRASKDPADAVDAGKNDERIKELEEEQTMAELKLTIMENAREIKRLKKLKE